MHPFIQQTTINHLQCDTSSVRCIGQVSFGPVQVTKNYSIVSAMTRKFRVLWDSQKEVGGKELFAETWEIPRSWHRV